MFEQKYSKLDTRYYSATVTHRSVKDVVHLVYVEQLKTRDVSIKRDGFGKHVRDIPGVSHVPVQILVEQIALVEHATCKWSINIVLRGALDLNLFALGKMKQRKLAKLALTKVLIGCYIPHANESIKRFGIREHCVGAKELRSIPGLESNASERGRTGKHVICVFH